MVMKLLCTLFFLGLAVMPAGAGDAGDASAVQQRRAEETGKTYQVFETRLGWTYRDVTVTKITDAGISIIHADGTARLGYERLTPEQRETFGITKEGAEAMYAKEEKAQAAYEAQIAAKQKKWQEEQQKAREERQKAHEALVAKQAARLEAEQLLAEQSQAERLKAQMAGGSELAQAQAQAVAEDTTSIVSVLEVPTFPIIRGPDGEILRPIPINSGTRRNHYYRSGGYTYPAGYGGYHYYPSPRYHCSPGYNRGYWGWLNYRRGDFNIGIRW